ncbi:asparagine synthase B [Gaopeijia maritima]|uniref:asparagine synthase B n=1 Tax=Gaopeijia maritima TaxID=3119007 RepID=UPI00324A9F2E
MCSILAILDSAGDPDGRLRERALRLSSLQRHRGPDWSGLHSSETAVLAHERLAIVDVTHGAQPLLEVAGSAVLAVNGEIYNHRELKAGLERPYTFTTDSDCEVILALYRERGTDFLPALNGIYAFVLHDPDFNDGEGRTLVARDPVGVVPLYMGWDDEGRLHVASEMKALVPVCTALVEFPPGHLLDTSEGPDPVQWAERPWADYSAVEGAPGGAPEIREGLEAAVHRQLMSDVPYGVLLSGGLDSSIIAAVAARFAARRVEDDDRSPAWWPRLHSFSIGLEGSPDLAVAEKVAEHIGTVHHGFTFTLQEGLDALRDAIRHLETYDVTTIRAGTPMMLLARRIRAMGIKMVLSGEGADEIFGGYLYFHKAPDAEAFHIETVRKLERLHLYDCLRANKAMAAWGVEARVPFLDLEFLDLAMGIDPAVKMVGADGVEKRVLREAFADLLPDVVLHRQKEQFSDGVGYGWIDGLRDHAAERVGEAAMAQAARRFPHNTPDTPEAYLYRSIFEEFFPLPAAAACVPGGPSVACSTPEALAWDESFRSNADPSGRAVRGVHVDSY